MGYFDNIESRGDPTKPHLPTRFSSIYLATILLSITGCFVTNEYTMRVLQPNLASESADGSMLAVRTPSSSSVSIEKNHIPLWPRFEFQELGFSVQLPLEKSDVETEHEECSHGNRLISKSSTSQTCDSRSKYVAYTARSITRNRVFLSSFTGIDYEGGELGQTIVQSKDLTRRDSSTYAINGIVFEPRQVLTVHGVEFAIIGTVKNNNRFQDQNHKTIGVVFNLPHKNESGFRTAIMTFYTTDVSEREMVEMINSIEFLKDSE